MCDTVSNVDVKLRRVLAERGVSFLAVLALSELLEIKGVATFEAVTHSRLLIASLSLGHPGLGPATLLAYLAYFSATSEGLGPLQSILIIPVAALSIRYWVQAILWVATLGLLSMSPLNYAALGALMFSLRHVTPSFAATLVAFYALTANVILYSTLPPGSIACEGFVVVMKTQSLNQSVAGAVGNWFFSNLLGPPNLLLLVLVYAASGASVPRLNKLEAGERVAPLVSILTMLISYYFAAGKLGLTISPFVVVAPTTSFILAITINPPSLKSPIRPLPEPPVLLAHLNRAWISLYHFLKKGEKIILVFGPRNCGKTLLITEVCAALGLKTLDGRDSGSQVIHVAVTDGISDLSVHIKGLLDKGVRSVVIETTRPTEVVSNLGFPISKAVYVHPPHREARINLLRITLGGVLSSEQIIELGEKTEAYGLITLIKLSEKIKDYISKGMDSEIAIMKALYEIKPDITIEDLLECEKFIVSYKGLLTGFAEPYLATKHY